MMEDARETQTTWYYRPWAIAAAILCFGPLGLVPLWFRPKTKLYIKTGVSIIVIVITVWVVKETAGIYKRLMEYYQELSQVMASEAG